MVESDFIHTTHTKNPFSVFAPQPLGISFEAQERGENIILLLRAHPITLAPTVLAIVLLAIGPSLALPVFNFLEIDITASLAPRHLFWIAIFWYLFTFGYAFYKFIFWYFNVYLLTNERIVDFDFRGILHKETSYANLSQIQDVSPKTIGFFGTFFHYGDVFIQTAAQKPEFEFHNVANPSIVAREILEQVRKEEKEAPGEIA